MKDQVAESDAAWPNKRPMHIALVLVAKAAVTGRVKTRLISGLISADDAALVHGAFLSFLRGLVETLAEPGRGLGPPPVVDAARCLRPTNPGQLGDFLARPILFIDPLGQPREQFDWPDWRTILQPPGDLGDRMRFCAQACFAENADAIIFIGVDSVHLTPAHLQWMAQSLGKSHAAMLPADDGGYVALGLRPQAMPLLDNIAWGTGVVARQTIDRAAGIGINLSIGDQLPDVDTPQDLRLLLAALALRQDSPAKTLYNCLRSILPTLETGDTLHDESRNDQATGGKDEC